MKVGWSLTMLFEANPERVEASRVDCGTCPVSLQCALSDGGNGWRFSCCGATGVEANGALLVMDCQQNTFHQEERAAVIPQCPLCKGDLVKNHVLGMADHYRYVPTVHAKVPVRTRLALFHEKLPEALALKKRIDERTKKK